MKNSFSKKVPKSSIKVWETWTMTDGKEISVDQMTEDHAKNVLNLTLKRIRESRELSVMKKYLSCEGKVVREIIDYHK